MGDIHLNIQGDDIVANLESLNTEEMLADAKRRFEEARAKNAVADKLLQDTAARNNEGAAYEKLGQEDEAIAVYEENIAEGYPATHAFDRLMKIYRRRKEYGEEIRVIRRAIEVFLAENRRRADKAAEDEPQLRDEIFASIDTGQKVMGSHGFYCFVPYDIEAYRTRLLKAENLQSKQQRR